MLEGRFLLIASVIDQDVVQSKNQDQACSQVNYILTQSIEAPVEACPGQQPYC